MKLKEIILGSVIGLSLVGISRAEDETNEPSKYCRTPNLVGVYFEGEKYGDKTKVYTVLDFNNSLAKKSIDKTVCDSRYIVSEAIGCTGKLTGSIARTSGECIYETGNFIGRKSNKLKKILAPREKRN